MSLLGGLAGRGQSSAAMIAAPCAPTNAGSSGLTTLSVSSVRLEVASESAIAVEPVRSTPGGRLLPGQSVGAEFLLRPRGSVRRAECRATLSYSASRSYARRSMSFKVEWPAAVAEAGD